jgi:hypothetical protein
MTTTTSTNNRDITVTNFKERTEKIDNIVIFMCLCVCAAESKLQYNIHKSLEILATTIYSSNYHTTLLILYSTVYNILVYQDSILVYYIPFLVDNGGNN